MNKIIIILMLILFSMGSNAQTKKNDSLPFNKLTLDLKPVQSNFVLSQPKISLNTKMMLAPNALFYDPTYYKLLSFNPYRRYFTYDLKQSVFNPIQPYGTPKTTAFCGTINAIVYLLKK